MSVIVDIDTSLINDWPSFHQVFSARFGFPEFYGRNMSAWVDCMTDLDDEDGRMTSLHVVKGDVLTIALGPADEFATRCPDQYDALIECAAFVNHRRIEKREPPVLALSFWRRR